MEAITRVFDLLEHNKNFPKTDIVAGKRDGKWTKYSTAEFTDLVNRVSRGLLQAGIKKGDILRGPPA